MQLQHLLQLTYSHYKKPDLKLLLHACQAFEDELRKHLATEKEVAAIIGLHNIGPLSLDTAPLKASLRAEAASWKTQFAKNLQKQGSTDLAVGPNNIPCQKCCHHVPMSRFRSIMPCDFFTAS